MGNHGQWNDRWRAVLVGLAGLTVLLQFSSDSFSHRAAGTAIGTAPSAVHECSMVDNHKTKETTLCTLAGSACVSRHWIKQQPADFGVCETTIALAT